MEPKSYSASPVGANFLVVSGSRSAGSVLFDPTLPVTDVHADINGLVIGLGHTFNLFGKLALASGGIPVAWLDATGLVAHVVGIDDADRGQLVAAAIRVPAGADGSPSSLDGVPFGQPALALAAQLQRRAARAGVPDELARLDGDPGSSDPVGPEDPAEEIGRELFRLVLKARETGRDPEMELRAAARRYRDLVRAWERS